MYRKTDAYDGNPHADFILQQAPRNILDQCRAALGLFAYIKRARPDAVLSYQHFGNLFGTIGGRLAGTGRLIANQSGAPLRGGLRGIATRLDRVLGSWGWYDHNIVNSSWTEAQFQDYPPSYRARLRRIEHGVSAPESRHDKQQARRVFGLSLSAPLVITTGRLNPTKNHAALVRAFSRLPGVHLAIAGAGPEAAELAALARELGVEDRFHLVGEIASERIFEFLATGDVFAFPSLLETFGLSVVEAAIAGLPVVATDLPVLREVLTAPSGEAAALFVPRDDPAALADALSRLLDDESQTMRLAAAGRSLSERYAPEEMCRAYEELLTRR